MALAKILVISTLAVGICVALLGSLLLLFTERNCNVQCLNEVKLTLEEKEYCSHEPTTAPSPSSTVTSSPSSTAAPAMNAATTSIAHYLSSFSSHLVPGVNVYFPHLLTADEQSADKEDALPTHTLSVYLPPPRARPEPVAAFIDLGSQGGNTHDVFLGRYAAWRFDYGLPANFSARTALAYMFEGNPVFCGALASRSCAVSFCPAVIGTEDALATFFLDVRSEQQWGSALNPAHPDTKTKAGQRRPLTLAMVDICAFLRATFKRGDFVILKVDIEGYEWQVMPALAADAEASQLVDKLFYEEHVPHHNATQRAAIAESVRRFQVLGVDVQKYDSPMKKK